MPRRQYNSHYNGKPLQILTFGNREYLHSTKSQGIRAHTQKLNNTTPTGLYNGHNRRRTAHTPETRTPENKKITTYNVSTNHPLPYKHRHAILVYPPYILSHCVKCFFCPVEIPNAPSHAHTHNTHNGNLRPNKPPPRTTTRREPRRRQHTNPQTTHPQPKLKTIDNTTYYHGPQTTLPLIPPQKSHIILVTDH